MPAWFWFPNIFLISYESISSNNQSVRKQELHLEWESRVRSQKPVTEETLNSAFSQEIQKRKQSYRELEGKKAKKNMNSYSSTLSSPEVNLSTSNILDSKMYFPQAQHS